jgi:hypothetical protein
MLIRVTGLLIVCSTCQIQAQSVSSSVNSSAGDYKVMPGYSLQYTLGESSVQTYNANQKVLTEGFQQNNLTINAIDEQTANSGIRIFPNPTASTLFIASEKFSPETQVTLFDMLGRVIMVSNKKVENHTLRLDITTLAQGSYIIQIIDNYNQTQYNYTVVKQ